MAAAYSTGASWSFPEDLPGGWDKEPETKPVIQDDKADSKPSEGIPTPPSEDIPTMPSDGPPPRRRRTHWPPRQCRICLDVVQPTFHTDADSNLPSVMQSAPRVTYESEEGGRLLSPCKCKGTQKYVHSDCLSAWRRADPLQQRNYWQCPTCGYRYRLSRLAWSSWISGTFTQLALTLAIFLLTVFVLGFVADPIINMYFDPIDTLTSAGGPTGGSFLYEGEAPGWTEHFAKGFAGLGLLGFAKWMLTLAPWQWFNIRNSGFMVGRNGNGRNRAQQINVALIVIGIATFLYAVWQGVRAWSRRTLESASERVLDVPGAEDDDDYDEDETMPQ